VNLLTLHRSKGLEFEAVFVPKVEQNELPHRRAETAEERRLFYVGITRAKRFLFVTWSERGRSQASPFIGEIRSLGAPSAGPLSGAEFAAARDGIAAETGLQLTVPGGYTGEIVELTAAGAVLELDGGTNLVVPFGETVTAGDRKAPLLKPAKLVLPNQELVDALKAWRLERSRADGVPAFVVLHDKTLDEIADLKPTSLVKLARVEGIGPKKLDLYGEDILKVIAPFN
jgi:DNA helicase II / ATP-dependent DNA helicase PcrA